MRANWPQSAEHWNPDHWRLWLRSVESQKKLVTTEKETYALPCPACDAMVTNLQTHGLRAHWVEEES